VFRIVVTKQTLDADLIEGDVATALQAAETEKLAVLQGRITQEMIDTEIW
jgi:hypothetical protein